MANEQLSTTLPLEASNRNTPPGWRPGDQRYPLRRYFQLLRLWWHMTDIPETAAGPAMASRLRGSAFQLALRLQTQRQTLDPNTGGLVTTPLVGAEALALERLPEFIVPMTGQVIPAQQAGATRLMHTLIAEYMPHQQNIVMSA